MDNIQFEKLTPISDGDISVYNEALDFVFENEDVQNVAISGAYGAGKSSVLASYKKAHPILKFMHISLAHFNGINDSIGSDTDGKAAEPVKESVLEDEHIRNVLSSFIKLFMNDKNNYYETVMIKLPSLCENGKTDFSNYEKIVEIFDNYLEKVLDGLVTITYDVFEGKKGSSLTSILKYWQEKLPECATLQVKLL